MVTDLLEIEKVNLRWEVDPLGTRNYWFHNTLVERFETQPRKEALESIIETFISIARVVVITKPDFDRIREQPVEAQEQIFKEVATELAEELFSKVAGK